jgi:hypothetical protein
MGSICLLLGLLMAAGSPQKPAPSFSNLISLPVDLYSAEGVRLEKGQYDVEVRQENGQYSLLFRQNGQTKATLKGEVLKDDASDPPTALPLIGTQYLRSSADPVGNEAERHFSKTGLAQYQEEKREWKAALRIYTTPDQKQALCLFEERQPAGKWSHVQFKLYLNPK